jgi:membrane associated rhomboid family serine protease
MFPYRDENETIRTPVVTFALIAANVVMWIFVQGAGETLPLARSVCNLGLIPGELTGALPPGRGFPMGEGLVCVTDPGPQYLHVLTSMFLHGDLLHLLGNMVFLLVFGRRVENQLEGINFLTFYLTTGISACLAHMFMQPNSSSPLIGASGAISGVLGAFFICNPRARITVVLEPVLIYFLHRLIIRVPAWIFLPVWFFLQISMGLKQHGSNVAFWAHVGGFAAGALVAVSVCRYIPKNCSPRQ